MPREGYDPNKYALYKYEDVQVSLPIEKPILPLDADTYFVLRSEDFASRLALRAYVQALRLVIDLQSDTMTWDQLHHLNGVADGAEALAEKWDSNPHRLPD